MSQESIVVHGPQGMGKNRYAKAIAKALGLSFVVDEFNYTRARYLYPTRDTLLLANHPPPYYWRGPVMTFEDAMKKVHQ